MLKKLFSAILALCMTTGALQAAYAKAEGTAPEEINGFYRISSSEDLLWFANEVNENNRYDINAFLENDIDLDGIQWTPIGDGYDYKDNGIVGDTAYNGIFDGNGHTVSNLKILTKKYTIQGKQHYDTYCQGLFGIIGKSGTVKNLTVSGNVNARAGGNEYVEAAHFVGGISGINAGLILNCTNNADITGHYNVGGISGAVGIQLSGKERVSGRIINCVNNGNVVSTSSSSAHAGGITGQLSMGTISYAANHGDVSAPYKENVIGSGVRIVSLGGIVGSDANIKGSGFIDRAYNDGNIGNLDGNYIAGIIGLSYNTTASNVYNTGKVTGANYSGGLAGFVIGGSIENAYSSEPVSTYSGYELVGELKNAAVKNAYFAGSSNKLVGIEKNSTTEEFEAYSVDSLSADMLGDAFIDTDDLPVLDFSGAPNGNNEEFTVDDFTLENGRLTITIGRELLGTNLTCDDFPINALLNGEGFELTGKKISQSVGSGITTVIIDFDPVNAEENLTVNINGIERSIITPQSDKWTDYRAYSYGGGDGSESNPYIISDAPQLALLSYQVGAGSDMTGKYFTISDDISLSGKIWVPIGNAQTYLENKYKGKAFNGTFDGLNHKITDINVSIDKFAAGLFGLAGEKSVIKNVYLYGEIRNTDKSGYGNTGGIAGVSYGSVFHCINHADIYSENSSGGIVGMNGAVNKTVTTCYIYRCANEGTVTADKEAGGITAYNSGTVDECYNKGEVTATGEFAGGIVGYNYEGSILLSNSYNSAAVNGTTFAGGISGKAYNSKIQNSYNSGIVSASSGKAGGILGFTVSDYNAKNCYYLDTTADMPYAENEGTGFEAKSDTELKELAKKLGAAFESSESFPVLKWENENHGELTDESAGLDIFEISVTNGEITLIMNKLFVMTNLSADDFSVTGVVPISFSKKNEANKTVVKLGFEAFEANENEQTISISVSFKENEAKTAILVIGADKFSKAPEYTAADNWQSCSAAAFESGNGTQEKPYIIKTPAQLAYLAKLTGSGENTKDLYYELADNLDLTEKLWTPIGDKDNAFKGHFDGNGFEITLNADGAYEASGLFGYTDGAQIKMLGIRGLSRTSGDFSGGLIANAKDTTLENCYSAAYVSAQKYSGGLIGYAQSGCRVTNCYSAGFSKAQNSGMLFGHISNGVGVKNLYYRTGSNIGAAGENASDNTSLAEGKTEEYMQSDAFAYELWLIKTKKSGGKTVKVDPVFYVSEGYPVLNSSYTDFSVISAALTAPGEKLESGAEHKFALTVYGKNVDKIKSVSWSASDGVTFNSKQSELVVNKGIAKAEAVIVIKGDVPKGTEISVECSVGDKRAFAKAECAEPAWSGKGTADEPFEIKTLDDLKALCEYVSYGNTYAGTYFKMTNDIDMKDSDVFTSIGAWYGLHSDDGGAWWEDERNRAFCGTFDGGGYSLKNAVFNAQSDYYGLFSYIGVGGRVENLKINSSCKMTAHNNIHYVGSFCGVNFGSIVNCTSNTNMRFTASRVTYLSGICGFNYGVIDGCINNSDITAAGTIKAGICGHNRAVIRNCQNSGKISGATYSGGITAENRTGIDLPVLLIDKFAELDLKGEIKACQNNGEISATADAGGITADNYIYGYVCECENSGSVTGSIAGGIAGRSSANYSTGGIKFSTNRGKINADESYSGGIVGEMINGLIYFCDNYGDITGRSYAGGICGRNYSSTNIGASAVDFCRNYASADGKVSAGIAGYYQDESGECYVRYNYSTFQSEYGIIGDINSKYNLDNTICENAWVCDTAADENGCAKGDLNGIELITTKDCEDLGRGEVSLTVSASKLKVNETASATSNEEMHSSDENVITVENGVVTAHGAGRAYVYARSNPYTYSAETITVAENPDDAEDVSVSFTLIGEENLGKNFVLNDNTENTYSVWISKKTYTVKKGSSVGELFKDVLDENGMKYQGADRGYVSSIQSPDGEWLGEFTNGKYSGWMYTVNGDHPDVGLNEYYLSGDEDIIWHYVDDYRQEVADLKTTGEYAPIGDGRFHNRWLKALDNSDDDTKPDKKPNTSGGSSSTGGSNSSSAPTESKPNTPENKISFTDVNSGAWYADAVSYAVQNKLFNGVSETEFAPEETMTRAILVTVLYRLDGAEKPTAANKFSDIGSGRWYTNAIIWAEQNGIVNGISDTEFAPDSSITREQLAAVIYRYAEFKKYDTNEKADISQFDDSNDIASWALEAVRWANAAGLVNGISSSALSPKTSATRAQTAAILMRFCMMNTTK